MAIRILRQGLPLTGFLKIGEPTSGAPVKFDHCELTTTERDAEGRLMLDVEATRRVIASGMRTCGGCPRSKEMAELHGVPEFEKGLPIEMGVLLPYDSLDLNFPHRLAYHRGRTEFCRGDGETAERRRVIGRERIEGKDVDKLGDFEAFGPCGNTCPDFIARRCKPKARLRFILGVQQNVGGCFEWRTTSWASIANLQESLEMIAHFTSGTLSWIPLYFEIHPQTVQPKGGGRAQRAYIARITFRGTPQELLETVRGNLQLRAPLMSEIRRLEARLERKWEPTPEEVEEFRTEFDPDNLAAEEEREPQAPAPAQPATIESAAQAPEPEPEVPAENPNGADPEARKPTPAERNQLWMDCKLRARALKLVDPDSAGAVQVLKGVLKAHGYQESGDIANLAELAEARDTAKSWPGAAAQ